MGDAPKEYTVRQVTGKSDAPWGDNKDMLTTKVRFEGGEREWKIFHNVAWGFEASQGDVLEGWFNHDKGTFGLSKRHKEGGGGRTSSSTGGGGGSQHQGADPRGDSIERQVAAKVAGEMTAACLNDGNAGVMCANFEGFFDAVLQKIRGAEITVAPQGVPVEGAPQMEVPADTADMAPAPAGVSDDSIPF